MQVKAYLSILVTFASVAISAPTPANGPNVADAQAPDTDVAIKKRIGGRFKPIWVVGYDEDEEKGEHIGFRYFSDGDKDGMSHDDRVKSHNDHAKAHDDHESSFWYYYYTY